MLEKNKKTSKITPESIDSSKSAESKQKKEKFSLWLRDTSGEKSASLTFAVVAFCVTTIAYIGSFVGSIGPIKFTEFDAAACGAYLVPILTLYFSRRFTTENFKKITSVEKNEE